MQVTETTIARHTSHMSDAAHAYVVSRFHQLNDGTRTAERALSMAISEVDVAADWEDTIEGVIPSNYITDPYL